MDAGSGIQQYKSQTVQHAENAAQMPQMRKKQEEYYCCCTWCGINSINSTMYCVKMRTKMSGRRDSVFFREKKND